ncbi:MAG: hypothetical protein ACMXX7_01375 [Candidatus Woesearchaeota archaeon]
MEFLDDAKEELKRVDHLIYVSLKYTRTVDVLLNAISRMIDAYDFIFQAILQKAVEQEKIEEIPLTPIEKGNAVKKLYPEDDQIYDNVELCFLLRKLHRSNPEKEQEYRRHVAMKSIVDGREEIVNIDIITQYYHFQLEFFKKINVLLGENPDG